MDADAHGDRFFIAHERRRRARTSSSWPRRSRRPGARTGPTVVAHRADVQLDDVDAFADHLVLSERADGLERLRVLGLARPRRDARDRDAATPCTACGSAANPEFDTPTLRYGYTSLVAPVTDVRLRRRDARAPTLVKRQPVLGGYDPTPYTSARLWATAPDGTRVPISLVHRARHRRSTAPRPRCSTATARYEISIDPTFSRVAPVAARPRASCSRSRTSAAAARWAAPWYEDGQLEHKRNTFTDFVACAEHLVARGLHGAGAARGARRERRRPADGRGREPAARPLPRRSSPRCRSSTSSRRCSTRRCRSRSPSGRSGATRDDPDDLRAHEVVLALRQRRRRRTYPTLLVTDRAQRPARAVLGAGEVGREAARPHDRRPRRSCCKTEMGAGHGGPSGRYDAWRDEAFVLAFVLDQLGLEEAQ